MLDTRLLRAFVAIVETGSFTRSADRLNMTQSTISQQLGRLEDAVGHELICRSERPARATAAGERLLGYARRILALEAEAVGLLSDPAGASPLRIGLPEDLVTAEMTGLFAQITAQRREVRIDVTAGLSRNLASRFRAGELDIAVVKENAPAADSLASFPEPIAWFEADKDGRSWPDPIPLVTFPPGGLYREAMFVAQGRKLRPCSLFGDEPPMAVSIYAWEPSGLVGEVIDAIRQVLAARARRLPSP
jgi:DNA-binding transcriptional LysR family regulator